MSYNVNIELERQYKIRYCRNQIKYFEYGEDKVY